MSYDILAEVEKNVAFAPFAIFLDFIGEKSKIKNDPTLILNDTYYFHTVRKKDSPEKNSRSKVSPRRPICHRSVQSNACPFHKPGHPLNKGNGFKSKSIENKEVFDREKHLFKMQSYNQAPQKHVQNSDHV